MKIDVIIIIIIDTQHISLYKYPNIQLYELPRDPTNHRDGKHMYNFALSNGCQMQNSCHNIKKLTDKL